MVDQLGKRYGKLPSEIISQADSFDVSILDVAFTYERYVNDKNNKDVAMNNDYFDTESLKEVAEKAKARNESK